MKQAKLLDNSTSLRLKSLQLKCATVALLLGILALAGPVQAVPGEGISPVFVIDTIGAVSGDVTVALPGGVPLVMVWCPAGSFQMGSPDIEHSRGNDEGPVHTVTLSHDFYMGKYEVTQAQWKAVMGSNPASGYGVGDDYPVYDVSWNDITGSGGFIERLNQHLASSSGQGGPVRLPSEAEWEYACRAGTTTRFYFGDSLTPADDNATDGSTDSAAYPGNRSDYMWWWFNCQGNAKGAYGAKPVGTKRPNAWGLYDMNGNVWEWCQDWYAESYSSGSATDPNGPVSGNSRVIRGGSWDLQTFLCRSAYRTTYFPDIRSFNFGFRIIFSIHIQNGADPQWMRVR